ncbi:MAG: hypothetical protein HKM93_23610 [Desulfobacteraceae bacterium]|nr:hypothetical protein [Desulfobacteraceae bacterium]
MTAAMPNVNFKWVPPQGDRISWMASDTLELVCAVIQGTVIMSNDKAQISNEGILSFLKIALFIKLRSIDSIPSFDIT